MMRHVVVRSARRCVVLILFAIVCAIPSQVGAGPVQSFSKGTVVDANGVDVGPAFESPFQPAVVLGAGGRTFTVIVLKQGFVGDSFLFEALGCAGPPFMLISNEHLVPRAGISAPGATVYLPDTTAPTTQPMVFHSIRFGTPPYPCTTGSTTIPVDAGGAAPPVALIDLSTVFTPPFSLRLTPGPPVTTQIFNDVPPSHPYFSFIQALAVEGLTVGCNVSPPLFCPDAPLTRGQAAVLFGRGLDLVP